MTWLIVPSMLLFVSFVFCRAAWMSDEMSETGEGGVTDVALDKSDFCFPLRRGTTNTREEDKGKDG